MKRFSSDALAGNITLQEGITLSIYSPTWMIRSIVCWNLTCIEYISLKQHYLWNNVNNILIQYESYNQNLRQIKSDKTCNILLDVLQLGRKLGLSYILHMIIFWNGFYNNSTLFYNPLKPIIKFIRYLNSIIKLIKFCVFLVLIDYFKNTLFWGKSN